MKKKLFAIILLVSVMTVYLPVYTNAAPIMTEISNDEIILTNAVAEQIINRYDMNSDITYQIADSIQLIGFNGDLYTYYELSPYGFAILYNRTGSLMEAYYESDYSLPISCESLEAIYYGGPGIYAILQNDSFVNLTNNTIIDTQTIHDVVITQNKARDSLTTISNTNAEIETSIVEPSVASDPILFGEDVSTSVAYQYFNDLTNFGDNNEGTCTIIAMAILLGYYDNYVNDNFVSNEYEQGNGTSEGFHSLLKSYAYGASSPDGISIYDAAKGIKHYIYDQGLNYTIRDFNSSTSVVQQIVNNLSNGKPVLASANQSHGAPWHHSVVIYSVSYNTSNVDGTAVVRYHTGWDNPRYYVSSASWFYTGGYMDTSSVYHNYSAWSDYNGIYHKRTCNTCSVDLYLPHHGSNWVDYNNIYHKGFCNECDLYIYEAHADHWNELTERCIRCNHAGSFISPINGVIDPILYATCLYE